MVGFGVIFSVIDAMPMRQREMKEKNSGPSYRGYGDKK